MVTIVIVPSHSIVLIHITYHIDDAGDLFGVVLSCRRTVSAVSVVSVDHLYPRKGSHHLIFDNMLLFLPCSSFSLPYASSCFRFVCLNPSFVFFSLGINCI